MQKKILIAAVAATLVSPLAFAQGNVNISGRISVGFDIYEVSGGTRTPYSDEWLISDQSSSLIFSGTEDLGGGLKAFFVIDNRFTPDTGTFGATGNTMLGLQGGFGKIGFGRSDLHYHEVTGLGAARSGSLQSMLAPGLFSQVNGTVIANGTRTPNVLLWDSPNWGGVTARVGYSTAPFGAEGSGVSGDAGGGDGLNLAARWSAGPLTLGASIWEADSEHVAASQTEQSSVRAWGGYTFGPVSVGLGVDQSSTTAAGGVETERTAFVLPVKFSAGANTFAFEYAVADDIDVGGTTTANSGASAFKVSWDHALSKRTFVGIHYTDLDNDAAGAYQLFARALSGTSNVAGEDVKQLYFGIAHFY